MNTSHDSSLPSGPLSGRRLPPLSMLRAFEAAARRGSVTQAADELNVTQSAVSHQIKLLEQWLGVRLITKAGRGMALTAAGITLQPGLGQAFDLMAQATARVQQLAQRPRLTVNAMPTVAAQWLIPRMPSFCAEMPDVDVQILTTTPALDFDPIGFEISLRCLSLSERARAQARSGWADVAIVPFLAESVTPLCSPVYLKRAKPLRAAADLLQHTLIHSRSAAQQWKQWFSAAEVPNRPLGGKLHFDHAHQSLQAAIQGLGVALASAQFAQDALQSGLLVAPFPTIDLRDRHYYWIVHAQHAANPQVRRFCDWLTAQGGQTSPGRAR